MNHIKNRLPPSVQIYQVLAVIAFMVYGWTITVFLYTFPSYINFLTSTEIMVLFAYSMTSAFFESLIILGMLLMICLILPAQAMRDVFLTRGTWAAIFGIGYLMTYLFIFSRQSFELIVQLPFWSLLGLLLTVGVTYFSPRFRGMITVAASVSDHLLIFIFLFAPLSLISAIVVLYRHIVL